MPPTVAYRRNDWVAAASNDGGRKLKKVVRPVAS